LDGVQDPEEIGHRDAVDLVLVETQDFPAIPLQQGLLDGIFCCNVRIELMLWSVDFNRDLGHPMCQVGVDPACLLRPTLRVRRLRTHDQDVELEVEEIASYSLHLFERQFAAGTLMRLSGPKSEVAAGA
jgi:hypothetical protein